MACLKTGKIQFHEYHRHRQLAVVLAAGPSFWQQNQHTTTPSRPAMPSSTRSARPKPISARASLASPTRRALNRVNTQLSQEIQNVLSGNTGQPLSSTTSSSIPTTDRACSGHRNRNESAFDKHSAVTPWGPSRRRDYGQRRRKHNDVHFERNGHGWRSAASDQCQRLWQCAGDRVAEPQWKCW